MDFFSNSVSQIRSGLNAPALALYCYRHVASDSYSSAMKNLEKAALAREIAELRLMRLLHTYSSKVSNPQLNITESLKKKLFNEL